MSRYIKATHVYQILQQVPVECHGKPGYTNPEFPEGTIICTDGEEWYKGSSPFISKDPDDWSITRREPDGTIQLFRDYWTLIEQSLELPDSDLAPYYLSIKKSTKTKLVP